MRIGDRRLNVPAHAQIERQAFGDAEVVLHVEGVIPVVVDLGGGRVLVHRGRQAQQEIGGRILAAARIAGGETERAVVVQQGIVHHLLEYGLAAQTQRMLGGADAEDVAKLVLIAARHRAGNRAGEIESPRHRNLRQRRRALNPVQRAEIAQRDGGIVDASAEVAHVGERGLVDHGGRHDPGFGDVVVVLPPGEIARDPRNIAQQARPIQAGGVVQAAGQAVRLVDVVIELEEHFVGVLGMRDLGFESAVGQQVGKRDVGVENLLGDGVDAVDRNHAPREGDDVVQRIHGRGAAGGRKVAAAFLGVQRSGGVGEHAGALAQAGVGSEDEGRFLTMGPPAVPPN